MNEFCNSQLEYLGEFNFDMGFIRAFIISSLVLGSSCVQIEISEVNTIVSEIVNKLDTYVHYHGNHSDVPTIPPDSNFAQVIPRGTTPYWYEEINHQGISAFGPSGYKVYRNVKDYGAKGMSCFCVLAPR
jgi:glucan 1,3-beta-glucosidase